MFVTWDKLSIPSINPKNKPMDLCATVTNLYYSIAL